jgi:hypothetical protein
MLLFFKESGFFTASQTLRPPPRASESRRKAKQWAAEVGLDVVSFDRLLDRDVAPTALNRPAFVELIAEGREGLPGQIGAGPESADVSEGGLEPPVGDPDPRAPISGSTQVSLTPRRWAGSSPGDRDRSKATELTRKPTIRSIVTRSFCAIR